MTDFRQDLATPLALEVHVCAARKTYRATWEGPNAEAHAVAFVKARMSTHAFFELEDSPLAPYRRLLDVLYPVCEHGLSATFCHGHGHYGPDR